MRKWIWPVLGILIALFFLVDPEPRHGQHPLAVAVSPAALELHREAFVIDLHVDSLLWPRDLLETDDGGHVDFPRMRKGGLDAAAFTIATRFFGLGGVKALHDLWPPATWVSPWARFRYQVQKMDRFVAQSNGRVRRATRAAELEENHRQGVISVFHGIEGAHALGTDVSRVREAAALGVLFIGPVHLSDNAYGGSSSGTNSGLTPLGRALVVEMNLAGVLIDLAHASPRTFDDALEATVLPPIVSHTGARAIHDTWRNLSDGQIRAVAARGGVIGQMLTPPALASPDLGEALRHLTHFIDVAGEDAVAIGSDFDGYVTSPVDVTGIPELTELMLRAGWSKERIKKVLGGNVLRLLERREAALK